MIIWNYRKAYKPQYDIYKCVNRKMEIRKLSKSEIEQIKNNINHGGRHSIYDQYLYDLNVGDMVEIESVNRGVISRTAKRLNMKLSVHYVNGKYYIERTA